ncbi:chloramphenicol acetyltransferase [Legionella birminghamensis]|uniref:Acetyltransferase n=1 Tax=Legionella birminghamensis TaxID=28083 RepID=A0A378ID92_9GAMM|nr:NeuD/PglB/VioB family sugar acetyltransferase [Legionella birminghamensis]KTC68750.1 chloramphenicol acetyltransferase [Legionella birminghamensis]STX30264.1 acetyltransferase [Legionella birminghamensis]
MKQLVILGFGGHARSVADIALSNDIDSLVFIDENAGENEYFLHYPVLKVYTGMVDACIPAAGDNHRRERQYHWAIRQQWPMSRVLSYLARQGVGSVVGAGTIAGHYSFVGPMAIVGKACIINNGAIIEHDCHVGNFCHISVNATLAGKVSLGDYVFVGAGAVVKDGITIGNNIIIGAGATVTRDLDIAGVYTGTPARLQRKFAEDME